MIDIVEYTNYLIENNLTSHQDVLCRLLASEQEGYFDLPNRQEAMRNFYAYYNTLIKGKGIWTKNSLDELENRGFIECTKNINEPTYDDYYVTKKYLNIAYHEVPDKWEMFEEFWETYPNFHESDGKKFNLMAISKEEVFDIYKKQLNNSSHELIMGGLKIAKAKNEVNTKISTWLKSESYKQYKDDVNNGNIPEDYEEIQQTIL